MSRDLSGTGTSGAIRATPLRLAYDDGFRAGLEAAAKHSQWWNAADGFYYCNCGQWDSRSGQGWGEHIRGLKENA